MLSPRKGKSLIQLRLLKQGTKKRFTTRLFMKTSEIKDPWKVASRIADKYPDVRAEIIWTSIRELSVRY